MSKTSNILIWILRIIPAFILLQTLWFKFSASPESVYIFSALHAEPDGRIASGIMELIAGVLLLMPRTSMYGAIIGAGVMVGAIISHIFVLGYEIMNDGGQLFIYAVVTFICCSVIVYLNREILTKKIRRKK